MKVFVYWNLHRGLWSVKALEGPQKGRVIAREPFVALLGATPKVSEAGRQRVLREQKKNVHAGIVGHLAVAPFAPRGPHKGPRARQVTYNPYKGPSFVYRDTGEDFVASVVAYLAPDKRVTVFGEPARAGEQSRGNQ